MGGCKRKPGRGSGRRAGSAKNSGDGGALEAQHGGEEADEGGRLSTTSSGRWVRKADRKRLNHCMGALGRVGGREAISSAPKKKSNKKNIKSKPRFLFSYS